MRGAPHPRDPRQRHEAHALTALKPFLHDVMELTGLEEPQAVCATVAVLGALEERLSTEERSHLQAQLPSRLREFIAAARGQVRPPPKRFHREELIDYVSEELGVSRDRAGRLVRAVLATLSVRITPGELGDVLAQLPEDLVALFPPLD